MARITPNLDELREELAITTDATRYDELVAAIREAEKVGHLHAAQMEVNRREKEAAERQEKLERYEAAHARAHEILAADIPALDSEIAETLAAFYQAVKARYTVTAEYTAQRIEALHLAEQLGLETPALPHRDSLQGSGDFASVASYATDLVKKHDDEARAKEKAAERVARFGLEG